LSREANQVQTSAVGVDTANVLINLQL